MDHLHVRGITNTAIAGEASTRVSLGMGSTGKMGHTIPVAAAASMGTGTGDQSSKRWKHEVSPHSLNSWQEQEVRAALKPEEHLIQHHEEGKPSYFTIDSRHGSRPFDFSVSFAESMGCAPCRTCCVTTPHQGH